MIDDLQTNLQKAFELQQSNQVDAAITLFDDILIKNPDQPDALHGLGLAYAQKQDFTRAIEYFKQAIAIQPTIAPYHNNLGNAYKAVGKFEPATVHYRQALRLRPNYAEAHNNLGNIYYLLGQWHPALEEYEKSIRIDPKAIDTHYNLANTYVQCERFLDAVAHYEAVLKTRSDHLGATHNLAITYCLLKRYAQAKPLLMKALIREPDHIDLLYHLALAQNIDNNPQEAIVTYQKILLLNPNHAQSHHNLATAFLRQGDKTRALEHYQVALSLQPDNATAAHMVAALTGKTTVEGAPLAYTQALFDQYAYNYNQHVKEKLQYQVPALLRQLITPYLPSGTTSWKAADLGCGTGLCAPLFADAVLHIVGVDISPNMVEIARQLGVYQKLFVEDILSFLERQKNVFDLLIAADVFIYFGELITVFKACHQSLKSQGLLCFSIETQSKEDFSLQPTGRYAHRGEYIHVCAKEARFDILAEETHTLRIQDDQPIEGNIYLLRKID